MSVPGRTLVPPPVRAGDAGGRSPRRRIALAGLLLVAIVFALALSAVGGAAAGVDGPPSAAQSADSNGTESSTATDRTETATPTDTPANATDTAGTSTPTDDDAETSTPTEEDVEAATATATSTDTETAPSTDSPTASATASATATDTESGAPADSATDAAFEVSNLDAPTAVRAGDQVVVTATVTNPTETDAIGRVNYSLAGQTAATERLSLSASESTEVTFRADTASLAPGTYVHGVRTASGDGVARRLRVTPDVDLAVRGIDAPTEIARGDPYVVLATVENPAESAITRNISYTFDGTTVATKRVTVAAGASERVAFEFRTQDLERVAGPIANGSTHTHAVDADGGASTGGEVLIRRGAGADPSALAVERFRASDEVRPGGKIQVNVSLRNVGEAAFEGQLAYRINGSAVDTNWLRVPVGEHRDVSFTLTHEALQRRGVLDRAGETSHGVWVGEEAVRTRPLTVHGPFETPTESGTVTFTPAGGSSGAAVGDSHRGASGTCERGLLTPCGGTGLDETTLTLIGIATSVVGILYEMTNG